MKRILVKSFVSKNWNIGLSGAIYWPLAILVMWQFRDWDHGFKPVSLSSGPIGLAGNLTMLAIVAILGVVIAYGFTYLFITARLVSKKYERLLEVSATILFLLIWFNVFGDAFMDSYPPRDYPLWIIAVCRCVMSLFLVSILMALLGILQAIILYIFVEDAIEINTTVNLDE